MAPSVALSLCKHQIPTPKQTAGMVAWTPSTGEVRQVDVWDLLVCWSRLIQEPNLQEETVKSQVGASEGWHWQLLLACTLTCTRAQWSHPRSLSLSHTHLVLDTQRVCAVHCTCQLTQMLWLKCFYRTYNVLLLQKQQSNRGEQGLRVLLLCFFSTD